MPEGYLPTNDVYLLVVLPLHVWSWNKMSSYSGLRFRAATTGTILSCVEPGSAVSWKEAKEMNPANNKATDEALIRGLIDDWAKAIRARDIKPALSHYAPDVLSFDVVDPLQYIGSDAIRKRAEQWVSSFHDPIGYEIRDLSIHAGDDVAFCHSLNRVNAITTNGNTVDMWWRATICFRKIDGKWLVSHQHNSVPFDPESGKASLGLKP